MWLKKACSAVVVVLIKTMTLWLAKSFTKLIYQVTWQMTCQCVISLHSIMLDPPLFTAVDLGLRLACITFINYVPFVGNYNSK